ncbi:MAG: hypothetical protein A2104_04715 [Candidatus Melainabacteria bacterium GWF2_32_7]|nr:MAG: hypothetical protein A2104_04715 [Candidatus Melainabacteria bacterium GWF2_32_7]
MAIDFNKFINPFSSPIVGVQTPPPSIVAPQNPQAGIVGAGNPFNKPFFGHLAGVSKSGPGSLLQTAPGETGLGDRAIKAQNGELGRKLFISC